VRAPFRRRGEVISVRLSAGGRGILAVVPPLLEAVRSTPDDPAVARLTPSAHPTDPEADREFRDLIGPQLAEARAVDRSFLAESLERDGRIDLTVDEAETWVRVIGEARLVLAARLDIRDDGWTFEDLPEDQTAALLAYLSWLQDSLVGTLMSTLPDIGG